MENVGEKDRQRGPTEGQGGKEVTELICLSLQYVSKWFCLKKKSNKQAELKVSE